jgi:hypothetical protein
MHVVRRFRLHAVVATPVLLAPWQVVHVTVAASAGTDCGGASTSGSRPGAAGARWDTVGDEHARGRGVHEVGEAFEDVGGAVGLPSSS